MGGSNGGAPPFTLWQPPPLNPELDKEKTTSCIWQLLHQTLWHKQLITEQVSWQTPFYFALRHFHSHSCVQHAPPTALEKVWSVPPLQPSHKHPQIHTALLTVTPHDTDTPYIWSDLQKQQCTFQEHRFVGVYTLADLTGPDITSHTHTWIN